MGIKEDSGKLLLFIYKEYTNNNDWIDTQKIIGTTKWNAGQINRVIDYLRDLGLIKIKLFIGNTNGAYNFGITGLTPAGLHMIEDKQEFKRNFGFEVNLGLIKIQWGVSEE